MKDNASVYSETRYVNKDKYAYKQKFHYRRNKNLTWNEHRPKRWQDRAEQALTVIITFCEHVTGADMH
jgi:hypothetical protein